MGLLDEMMGKTAGQAPGGNQGGNQGALVQALLGMLGSGGLQSILQGFTSTGLGNVVQSWISTGPNEPVSPGQVEQAIPGPLGQLSQQTGLDRTALASQLSQLLPGLVDKLTPDGKLPEGGGALEQGLGMLRGLLK